MAKRSKKEAALVAAVPYWGSIEGELVPDAKGNLSVRVGNDCVSLDSLVNAQGRYVEFRVEFGEGVPASSDSRLLTIQSLATFLANRDVIGITAKVTCCKPGA